MSCECNLLVLKMAKRGCSDTSALLKSQCVVIQYMLCSLMQHMLIHLLSLSWLTSCCSHATQHNCWHLFLNSILCYSVHDDCTMLAQLLPIYSMVEALHNTICSNSSIHKDLNAVNCKSLVLFYCCCMQLQHVSADVTSLSALHVLAISRPWRSR